MTPKIYLGEFEQTVLLAILHLADAAYATSIIDEIETRTGRKVSRGALYVTLDRMEDKGLVSSRFGEPTASRGGRAKRYVKVTRAGLSAVRESVDALQAMRRGLDTVLKRS